MVCAQILVLCSQMLVFILILNSQKYSLHQFFLYNKVWVSPSIFFFVWRSQAPSLSKIYLLALYWTSVHKYYLYDQIWHYLTVLNRYKLDGVGPVDNRHSTNNLHHSVQKEEEEKRRKTDIQNMTCDTWHVTCDRWHVTCDMRLN